MGEIIKFIADTILTILSTGGSGVFVNRTAAATLGAIKYVELRK